jgi:TPR repeat protein
VSLYRRFGVVAVTLGMILLCCGKDTLQPAIEAPPSDDQERDRPQKGDPSLRRLPSQTATAIPKDPPATDQVDSDDFFSAGLSKQRKKDYKGAIELFERACAEGQDAACYQLGVIYRDGVGVAVSDRRAQSWFQLACQKGSVAACDALGH